MSKIEKIPELVERVDKLRETDHPYEDSAKELAKKEDKFRGKLEKYRERLKKKGFDDQELKEYIEELADDFSNESLKAIENKKEGMIDKLTGVGNRQFIEAMIPKFLSFEKRENHNCSIIMVDIDHFKDINDEHGHFEGDKVLKDIVDVMGRTIRGSDFVIRYGGEEFAIFCPDTNLAGAQEVSERIRAAVEEEGVRGRTISLGCMSTSEIPEWKSQTEGEINFQDIKNELLAKADQALYCSKDNGRNQVTLYRPDLPPRKKSQN